MRMTAAILHAVLFSRVLSTCAQDARLEDDWRVWRSHTGAAVTAVLSSVRSGVAVLRGSNATYTVQIQSLTPEDVKHIYSFYADEKHGYDEHYPWAEKQAARREHIAQMAIQRQKELADYLRALFLSSNPSQGDIGLIHSAEIVQILTPTECLIQYSREKEARTALLSGVSTTGLADDTPITLHGQYIIDGTHTFETAIGARRTVLVIRPYSSCATGQIAPE